MASFQDLSYCPFNIGFGYQQIIFESKRFGYHKTSIVVFSTLEVLLLDFIYSVQ